jgi:hypothetical protein
MQAEEFRARALRHCLTTLDVYARLMKRLEECKGQLFDRCCGYQAAQDWIGTRYVRSVFGHARGHATLQGPHPSLAINQVALQLTPLASTGQQQEPAGAGCAHGDTCDLIDWTFLPPIAIFQCRESLGTRN